MAGQRSSAGSREVPSETRSTAAGSGVEGPLPSAPEARNTPSADRRGSGLRSLLATFSASIWPATLILFVLSPFVAHGSLSRNSLNGTLPFAAILAIAAMGQTLVVQQRGLDLSVPGAISLSAIIVSLYAKGQNDRLGVALLLVGLTCVVSGAISALVITKLRVTPLVATLAVNALLIGTILRVTSGSASSTAPPALVSFAFSKTLGIPHTVLLALLLVVVLGTVMRVTLAGRRFVVSGSSPSAAYAAGLRVLAYVSGAYVGAALLYGLAGVLLAGYVRTPGLSAGDSYLLPSVAAVVLGGTALAGGRGSLAGTAVAALFLTQLQQVAFGAGAPPSVQLLIQGGVIAIGMGLRNVRGRPRTRGSAAPPPAPPYRAAA